MLSATHIFGKKIFVTGGTGFLGRHLVPKLVTAGAHVTCLARASSKKAALPGQINWVGGDCITGQGLRDAMKGQDIVIHMAGLLFGTGWNDYLLANFRASHNVAEAIENLGHDKPTRLVFVSSLAAVGPCGIPPGLDENNSPAPVSAYGWSKLLSEQILCVKLRERLVIVRPPIIYGSGDNGLLPMFKSAKMGLAVSPGAMRQFPVSAIHASDAANAIILACQEKAEGIYHLSDGQIYDMDRLCQAMGAALGRKSVYTAHLPLFIMGASAAVNSCAAALLKKLAGIIRLRITSPRWNLDKYREARQPGWLANSARICNELGFEPEINLEQGMKEAVEGYRAEGLL